MSRESYISLATPILPPEKLYPTPSMQEGLTYEDEFDLRLIGCELIQTSGRLLKLPQTAMATGQVLFHRYFYCKSFVKNNMEHYAMAAIFLSSKIEECPRRIRDVMNVFSHIKQVRTGKIIKPLAIDQAYNELRNNIIKAERRILKELGFCVHVKHPHKTIFIYLTAMECSQMDLVQKAWNYMNDCLRTDVFLRYTPETVACACIYLSARELQIPLPRNPPWYSIFGADEDVLKAISIRLIHLYSHKTKSQEELEKIVNDCRELINQEKKRVKDANQIQGDTISHDNTTLVASVDKSTDLPNTNNINITVNIINSHHHHHQQEKQEKHQQIQHQIDERDLNVQRHGGMIIENGYQEDHLVYPSMYHRHHHLATNGLYEEIRRHSSKEISYSHKKHKSHSKVKSKSRSRSRSTNSPSKHKSRHHKRRTSKEKHHSRSRSKSTSPSKHKKKKYHHDRSRSKTNSRGVLPVYS